MVAALSNRIGVLFTENARQEVLVIFAPEGQLDLSAAIGRSSGHRMEKGVCLSVLAPDVEAGSWILRDPADGVGSSGKIRVP
jgi:hypothetical protein